MEDMREKTEDVDVEFAEDIPPAVADYSRSSNIKAVFICLFAMSGALLFGIDNGTFGGFMAMTAFLEDFGYFDSTTQTWNISTSIQNAVTMMILGGSVVASMVSGPIGTYLGRHWGLFITAVVSILGVLLQITSANLGTLIVGRFFSGMGIGFSSNFVTVYNSEVSPAHLRSMMIGLYQTGINIGTLIGACVDQGTHALATRMAYRIPLITQLIFPTLLIILVWFFPDTPRWYLTRDRPEKAAQSLRRLRGKKYPEAQVEVEIADIAYHVRLERQYEQSSSYWDLFKGTDLRRTHIACGLQFWQQWSGITFISTFATYFYSVSGVSNPFTANMINTACQLAGGACMFPLAYYLGPRKTLLLGGALQTLAMLAFAIAGSAGGSTNIAASKCLVAFSCIYGFAFNFSWGPLAWSVTTEIPSSLLRSRTQSLSTVTSWGFNLVITAWLPYLINDSAKNYIGSGVGYIFGGMGIIGFFWAWWFLPDTKGRSLEELDELFLNNVPVRDWTGYKCTGHVAAEDKTLPEPAVE